MMRLTRTYPGRRVLRVTGGQTPDDIEASQAILRCLRESGGDRPTFQAVDQVLRARGTTRPDLAVLSARELGYLWFDGGLGYSVEIGLTVAGHYHADPHDRLLHLYFLPVIRSLVDRLDREPRLLSPTEARRVIVFAHEMEPLRSASTVDTKMIGRLLDVESVGRVEWMDDPDCPWSIEIDFTIREFANIGSIPDFLEVTRWKRL